MSGEELRRLLHLADHLFFILAKNTYDTYNKPSQRTLEYTLKEWKGKDSSLDMWLWDVALNIFRIIGAKRIQALIQYPHSSTSTNSCLVSLFFVLLK